MSIDTGDTITEKCATCHGTGRDGEVSCPNCHEGWLRAGLMTDYKLNRAKDTLQICRARMDAIQEQVEADNYPAALVIALKTISDFRDAVEDVLDVRREI